MKKALFPLAIMIVLLFAFVAVSCNSDLYKPQNDTWAIGDMYFEKFSEAVSWLSSQDASREVSPGRTIKLLKDVNNAESIIVPQTFSGDVRIDFQWHSYVFSSDNQYFFKVEGGSNVEIVNERAVIPSGSSSSEKAIIVNGAKVVADNLSVDDRRANPQAVEVGSSGALTLSASSGDSERKMLGGAFVVNSGSQLVINGGFLEIDSLNQLSDDVIFAINGGTVHYPHEIASFIENAASSQTQMVAIHDISGWIDSDPGVHYKECTHCHARFEESPHQFSQWTYDSLLGVSTRVCSVCGRVEELDHKHEIVAVPYKEKTCTADGHSAYWHCPVCNQMFGDSEGLVSISWSDVCIPASHNLVHVPFSAHTCTEDGVVEHWFCQDCGKAFADQNAAVERTSIVIPAAHQMVYHEPDAATCTASGMLGYWSCSVCGGVFADQLGKQGTMLQNLIVPATGHSPLKREAHEATCGFAGNTEYWICNTCGQLFSDEACSHEIALSDTVVPALVHNPVHTEAVEPTCTSDGNIGYWTCSHCAKVFSDEQCTNELFSSVVVSKLGHLLSHIGAVPATCTAEGNVEYWKCSRCGLLFADEQCADLIDFSDTVVSRTAHSLKHTQVVEPTCLSAGNIEYWTCSECGKHFADSLGTAEISSESLVLAKLAHSLEHTDAVAPTCTVGGNIEYWRCAECGRYFSDAQATNQVQAAATVIAKKGHSPVHHNYNAPTCTVAGQLEHWTCPDCGKSFLDEACTIEAEPSRLVLEKLGHEITHVAELGATCTQEGHIEYWQCSRCNLIWSDSGLTDVIASSQTVIPSLGHDLRHVEAIEASCTSTGNTEHWICNTCGRYFSDAGAQHEITAASTVTPAKGHTADIHVAAKSASCTEDGNIEYWECSECGTLFSDSQCRNSVSASDVILGAIGHSPEHHDAVAATCTSSGNIEYWKCLRCGKLFSDSELTSEITLAQTVVAPLPHGLVHYNYVSATCTEDGSAEHWHCSVCGNDYADADASVLLDDIDIPAYGHDLEHFDAVAATCTEDGNTAYAHCVRCGLYFNAAGTQTIELASTVVPATGHNPSAWVNTDVENHYKVCSVCGEHIDEAAHSFGDWSYNPETGLQERTCTVCGYKATKAHTHVLQFHAAVAHTCVSDGTIAYYECTECHRRFKDEGQTIELVSITDPASHSLNHVDAVAATCTATGTMEHWHCSVCGKDYTDSNASGQLQTTVIAALGHDLENIDAVAATCTEAGHTAYKHCLRCGLYFNAAGTQTIDLASTVVAATGHSTSAWVTTDAEFHYKVCSVCGEHLDEAAHSFGEWTYNAQRDTEVNECTVCHREVERVHEHELVFHAAVTHTCAVDGNIAYYECTECGRHFKDANGTMELASIVDPASHSLNHVDAVAATCTATGIVEHWHCSVCGKDYADSSASSLLQTTVVAALGHDLEHFGAVAATCTEAGHTAYKHCLRCDLYFNAAGTQTIELASTVIVATGHTPSAWVTTDAESHYKVCSVCGEHLEEAAHSFGGWTYDAQTDKEVNECSVCHRVVQREHAHEMTFHAAVPHTCTSDGTVAYYECTVCEKRFKDANGAIELVSIVDPAAHSPVHHDAVASTCLATGTVEYWHCSICGKNYSDQACTHELDSLVVAKLSHQMTHHEAVEATCQSTGSVEYWTCSLCGLDYLDEEGSTVLNQTVVSKKNHSLVHHAAVPATCTADGNIEYWECSECHTLFADDAATVVLQISPVLARTGHSLVHHDAVASTCLATGTVEYWHCSVCGYNYSDSEGTNELLNLVVPKLAHTAEHITAVAPTCTSTGVVEHWHCSDCGLYFSDSACTQEIDPATTVIAKKPHAPVMTEAKAATCTFAGNIRYWTCSSCGKLFSDAGCTVEINQASTVVPALGHSLEHTEGIAATCTATGTAEHWHCSTCGKDFADAQGKNELATTIIATIDHSLVHHAAVAATCTEEGTVEYWSCSSCQGLFADEACTIELTAQMLAVPELGHSLVHTQRLEPTCTQAGHIEYWTCSRCSEVFSDAAGLHQISLQETALAAKGHSATGTPAVAATCTANGNSAYWYCAECGHYFSDSACTHQIAENSWVIQSPGHSLSHVSYVAPTCTQTGTAEHWHCSVCGKNYSDSLGTSELANVIVPASGHSAVVTAAKAPTCTQEGNTIYWICSVCGRHFSDERCQNEIAQGSWILSALGHNLVFEPAVAATCTSSGLVEHWHCSVCGHDFSDAQASSDITGSVVVAPLGHSTVSTAAVSPTCTSAGNSAYWTCTACGRHFSDAACTTEISEGSWIIGALGHSLEHVDAVAPTCVENGNIEHWRCTRCLKTFEDSEGSVEIAGSVVLVATGHSFSGYEFDENRHWLECSVCHAQVNAASHQWGEEKDCLDGHHRVHECSVCGAFRNETVAGYQIINTSIGTISVPLAESAPCGTMKIVRIGNTVKVKFVPNINSNPNYSVTCRYLRGTWSDYLVPDADSYYVFNVDGTSNYKIVIQAYNGGGTSVYETTIR